MSKTLGESRVRTSLNPANAGLVDLIKQKTAELIDLVNNIDNKDGSVGEFIRIKSLAMTEYESAGHWAVKAATFGL